MYTCVCVLCVFVCMCARTQCTHMEEWMLKYLICQLSAQSHLLRWVVTHIFHNRWTSQLRGNNNM